LALCISLQVEAERRIGVQVVEGVGSVASGSQFTPSLAAVFAEEFGGFAFGIHRSPII
tara:strand:- start:218 stop:391 length:174 start_codon:yes stop_codon:yes gene_type:complete